MKEKKCKYCGDIFIPEYNYEEFCTSLCIKTYRRISKY